MILPPSEKDSDRYTTPPKVLDRVGIVWPLGIDVEPFFDPESDVEARHVVDCRDGGNAYVDPLPIGRMFANGPYSGKYPQATAALCMRYRASGGEFMNLCPAAPGSEYWRRYVWPWTTAIVWLGRLGFKAATDIIAKDGRLICPKGKTQGGNRTEIALAYGGDDPELVREAFADIAVTTINR